MCEHDLFISYSRQDVTWVDKLDHALREKQCKVWRDTAAIQAGAVWAAAIERAIEQSCCYGIVATNSAFKSKWVLEEYYGALVLANKDGQDLAIVVIYREDVKLPLFLRSRQHVDFRRDESFGDKVKVLIETLAMVRATPVKKSAHPFDDLGSQTTLRVAVNIHEAIAYLRRSRDAALRQMKQLSTMRLAIVGVLGSMGVLGVVRAVQLSDVAIGVFAAGAMCGGAVLAWGLSTKLMADLRVQYSESDRLEQMFEDCREDSSSECKLIWRAFWRYLHQRAGAPRFFGVKE